MVAEAAVGDTLAHQRMADVARKAGLSPAAFYHYWPTQERYWKDVLTFVLADDRVEAKPDFLPDHHPGDNEADGVLAAAQTTFDAVVQDPHFPLMLGLWVQQDPAACSALARRSRRAAERW